MANKRPKFLVDTIHPRRCTCAVYEDGKRRHYAVYLKLITRQKHLRAIIHYVRGKGWEIIQSPKIKGSVHLDTWSYDNLEKLLPKENELAGIFSDLVDEEVARGNP